MLKLLKLLVIAIICLIILPKSFSQQIPYRWQNVAIGGGGYVTGIVTSEAEKGLIYCKTDVGGAYRWDTTTFSWIPLNDDLTNANWGLQGIESIALDPTDPSKIYLAAGEYTQWSESAILRSTDKGNNWTKSKITFKCGGNDYGRSVDERLVVDPNLPSTLFMGTRISGLWKSTDTAKTWQKVSSFTLSKNPSNTGITFIKFIKSSGEQGKATPLIFLGFARKGADNLFVSRDTGNTWQAIPNHDKSLMPVHAAVAADTLLYIAYSDSSGPFATSKGALVKYNIKSGEFTTITPNKTTNKAFFGISVYSKNPQIIYASTINGWPDQIFRSTDGGKSWKDITTGANRKDYSYTELHWVADVEVDPFDSDHVLFVTGYGIWSTFNASNIDNGKKVDWYFTDKGLEETVVQGIVSPSYGAPLLSVIGDYTGFYHEYLDSSAVSNMFKPSIGSSNALAVSSLMPNFVARAGSKGLYSLDYGKKWTEFKKLPVSDANQGKMAISALGTTLIWTPVDKIPYYTRDKGASWSACEGISVKNLKPIADFVNDNYFYFYDNTGNIYVSDNGGSSFAKAASVSSNAGDLSASLGKEGHLWLPAKANGLYFSNDHGTSFTKIESVQAADGVTTGAAFPGKDYPSVYIIGKVDNAVGFFRSDDKGQTWSKINNDKQNFGGINLIAADARVPGRVYVASNFNGRGILYGVPLTDCNGDSAGTAYIDDCGVCAGGKTGTIACVKDCHGDVNGTATIDKCGVCSGGNTGLKPDSCLSNAIEKKLNEAFSVISPNPFNEFTVLKVKAKVQYEIFNVFGEKVEEGIAENSKKIGANLRSGIYIINVFNKNQKSVSKLVRN